ncbi:hypothetical protein [Chromobacterium alticapitis]|uniref:Uncharacterized protein n=1 Tax=Chromobacterium alticapitis TaxID=2073169 RepID=A0A2S5DHU6_9NEIS|nr:hypothetical protein [Chromobacterium alticapitis]POZ62650.1 hypothetical protein C2I19_07330 [Chromobacterium alticapitis]
MWPRLAWPAAWRGKPSLLTLTDVALRDGLIHCAYQLKLATRNHHAPAWDVLKTPDELMASFVHGYLGQAERELLAACDACNQAVRACRDNDGGEIIRMASGQQLTIMLLGPDGSPRQCFTLGDLARFTGLCRRYRSPGEVERLLQGIFAKVAHG